MASVSQQDDFVSEINVTPFVDVMLVLLIIFMVTAPMMTEGLDVDLPRVEASETLPTEQDHMILTVKADGALFLDEYETGLADLERVLEHNVKKLGRQLFVRADKGVPYGQVMEVMGKIRAAGIHDVGLVTTSSPSETERAQPANNSGQSEKAIGQGPRKGGEVSSLAGAAVACAAGSQIWITGWRN